MYWTVSSCHRTSLMHNSCQISVYKIGAKGTQRDQTLLEKSQIRFLILLINAWPWTQDWGLVQMKLLSMSSSLQWRWCLNATQHTGIDQMLKLPSFTWRNHDQTCEWACILSTWKFWSSFGNPLHVIDPSSHGCRFSVKLWGVGLYVEKETGNS